LEQFFGAAGFSNRKYRIEFWDKFGTNCALLDLPTCNEGNMAGKMEKVPNLSHTGPHFGTKALNSYSCKLLKVK